MVRFYLIITLVGGINFINTLSYAVHISGVATKRLATASSLFNILALFFHMLGGVQAPLLAKIVDNAIIQVQQGASYTLHQGILAWGLRMIIWGGVAGTVCGVLVLPSFYIIFTKAIYVFDKLKSVFGLFWTALRGRTWRKAMRGITLPSLSLLLRNVSFRIPFFLVFLHMLVTAFYTVCPLSAIYAGFVLPHYRTTIISLAPLIMGLAGIILVIMVEPIIASITDEAMRGVRPFRDVKAMVLYLVGGRLAGVILAQVILFPLADLLVRMVRWV